ncbi:MAG: hypothetical protein M3Y60_10255 [Bacteroidota bacterium]|nr:hypothetical protein [Bacteroidota bacterium]
MKAHLWMIAKTVVKNQLDVYILPGTTTGTEILLLYIGQWKRNIALATSATFSLVFSQKAFPDLERISTSELPDRPDTVPETLS